MQYEIKVLTLTACAVFVLCAVNSGARAMKLSRHSLENNHRLKRTSDDQSAPSMEEVPITASKRTCNAFPCMYSHLGTKAGRASLYKTLAGFIDDCFNDPSCSPGRRKRQDTHSIQWRTQQLINTPLRDLVRWRMRNGH